MDRDVNQDFDMTKAVPDMGTAFSSSSAGEKHSEPAVEKRPVTAGENLCGTAVDTAVQEPASSAAATFSCTMTVFGFPITAYVLIPDEGIQVCVWGGEKSHIGALSVIAPDGSRSDLQFPGHKDGVIAARWADVLKDAGYCPVVVSTGIHYDHLSKEEIRQVVKATDGLLTQVRLQLQTMIHTDET